MKRTAFAIVCGFVLWTVIWLGGNAGLGLLFPEQLEGFEAGGSLDSVPYLAAALLLAATCSFAAGHVCGKLGKAKRKPAVLGLAFALLAVGLAVQSGVWDRMPLWYHLVFLFSIVPLCIAGGRCRTT